MISAIIKAKTGQACEAAGIDVTMAQVDRVVEHALEAHRDHNVTVTADTMAVSITSYIGKMLGIILCINFDPGRWFAFGDRLRQGIAAHIN
jgi:hypothetical protein